MHPFLSFLNDLAHAALFETWGAGAMTLVLFLGAGALGLVSLPSSLARPALRVLAGFPLAMILGGGTSVLFFLMGFPVGWTALVAIGGALACIAAVIIRDRHTSLFAWRELGILFAFLLAGYVIMFFGWGETRDGTIRAVPGAWADGPLHTLNAEAFRRRSQGDMTLPISFGEIIREPLGYDHVAGMFRAVGVTVGAAQTLPAAALLACLMAWSGAATAYLLRARMPRPRVPSWRGQNLLGAAGAMFLVVFGSGLQWITMASVTSSWSFARFFGVHSPSWDKVEERGLIWSNHVNTFASQKHFLLAAAFLVVVAAVLLRVSERRRLPQLPHAFRAPLAILAVTSGLLPLFHAHVFLAVVLVWCGAWWACRQRALGFALMVSCAIAAPTFYWYQGAVIREGFLAFAPGYLAPAGVLSWLWFWVMNLGLAIPLAALSFWRRRQEASLFVLAAPALALFGLGNLVRLQPYHWDNYKIFLSAWILLLPLLVSELTSLANDRRWVHRVPWGVRVGGIILGITLMSLTTISELATYFDFRASYPVYTEHNRLVARNLDLQLPRDAVVLGATDTVHRHPLTLTGRNLVLGYGGWIWTRGLPLSEREAAIGRILHAATREEFCVVTRALEVTHLVVGQEERSAWGAAAPSAFVANLLDLSAAGTPEPRVVRVATVCA